MQKRKVLVTGSEGTVGSYISSIFKTDTLLLTTKKDLDITNKNNISKIFNTFKPEIVIHLAAKTNVDECEKNEAEAYLVNTLGTKYLAEECKKLNAFLLYVSTGAVFNGTKKYYTEKDSPNPVNVYGKTKLQGEEVIKKIGGEFIIIRSGWIIGGGMKEKKFISYIFKQIKNGEKEIQVINDTFGTLTYAKELVQYMKILIEQNSRGIYHFGSTGVCSRYDIATQLVKLLYAEVKVIPVSSSVFSNTFTAPRPKNEVMRSVRPSKNAPKTWKKSLTDYVKKELQYE